MFSIVKISGKKIVFKLANFFDCLLFHKKKYLNLNKVLSAIHNCLTDLKATDYLGWVA